MGMIFAAVATSLIASVLYGELAPWSPKIARWIVRKAAAKHPGELGERLAEEWLALIEAVPSPFAQLFLAMNYAFASIKIAYERTGRTLGVRAIELSIVVGVIAFTGPLLVAVALAGKLTGKGSIFVFQHAETADGRPFRAIRFRTVHAGKVTPYGAFLRRSSLNELPLLINVLRGEMSLVDTTWAGDVPDGSPASMAIFPREVEPDGYLERKLLRLNARYGVNPRIGTYLLILLLHCVRLLVTPVPRR